MIADLPKNREIGASWLVSFVFQCLLSGRFTKYLPALSSFSYGMALEQLQEPNPHIGPVQIVVTRDIQMPLSAPLTAD